MHSVYAECLEIEARPGLVVAGACEHFGDARFLAHVELQLVDLDADVEIRQVDRIHDHRFVVVEDELNRFRGIGLDDQRAAQEGDFRRLIGDRGDPVAFSLPFEGVIFRQTNAQVEVMQLNPRRCERAVGAREDLQTIAWRRVGDAGHFLAAVGDGGEQRAAVIGDLEAEKGLAADGVADRELEAAFLPADGCVDHRFGGNHDGVVVPGFAPLADADVFGDVSQNGQLLGEVGPEQRGETDEVFGQGSQLIRGR